MILAYQKRKKKDSLIGSSSSKRIRSLLLKNTGSMTGSNYADP